MESCLICFSGAADQPVACTYDSLVWKKYNITRIIEKHLWWWHLPKSSSKKFSHICRDCWESLSSFHDFYLKVQQKHKQFDAEIWPALKGANKKFNENNQELDCQNNEDKSICKIVIANDNERIELTPCSKSVEDTNIDTKTDTKEKKFNAYELRTETTREYDEYLAQTNYQFSCHLCNISLRSFSELTPHYRKEHNVKGYAMCCNKKFYNRGQICDHLRVHEDPDYFKCTICNRVLCHRRSYENHIKIHKRPTFDCNICDMAFSRKHDLEAHSIFHDSSLVDETTVGSYIDTCESFVKSEAHDDDTDMLIGDAETENIHFTDDLTNSGSHCTNNDDKTQVLASNIREEFNIHILEKTEQSISPVVKSEPVDSPEFEEHLFNTTNNEEESPGKRKPTATEISRKSKTEPKKQKMLPSDREDIKFYDDLLSQAKYNVACDICGLSFSRFREIKTHYRVEHKIVGYATCCNKKYHHRVDFADHLMVHENPNHFKCTFCSRVLCHRASFKDHLARHKFVDKKDTKSQADSNVHRHHADEDQSLQCAECNKVFANVDAVIKHKAKMHPKEYKASCDLCGKLFYNPTILKNHLEREHEAVSTETKEISCNVCYKTFTNKRVLFLHKKTAHSEELKQEHICPICYHISQNLNDHKKHMIQSHTNQRKHACNLCKRTFTKSWLLRDHLSTHTGMPMNSCPHCSRKFKCRSNMNLHRKKKHPKEWLEAKNKNLAHKHII